MNGGTEQMPDSGAGQAGPDPGLLVCGGNDAPRDRVGRVMPALSSWKVNVTFDHGSLMTTLLIPSGSVPCT